MTIDSVAAWQKCPRCDGQGHTAKPPWVPGDIPTWDATNTRGYTCPACGGAGVLSPPPRRQPWHDMTLTELADAIRREFIAASRRPHRIEP